MSGGSGDMNWSLLPVQAAFALRVGDALQGGHVSGFPSFPAWLGKFSTTSKKRRLTQELVAHSMEKIAQGFASMRMDYAPYLPLLLVEPMARHDDGAVAQALERLDWYGFSREDLVEGLRELQFVVAASGGGGGAAAARDVVYGTLSDRFERLDAKVKAELTREYNKMAHRSQALVAAQGISKQQQRKKERESSRVDEADEADYGDEDAVAATEGGKQTQQDNNSDQDDDNDDDDAVDTSAFVKKSAGGKRKSTEASAAAASTSTSASKKPRASGSGGAGAGRKK